jgi:uncharacterized protein (TIGR04255 family)
VLERRKYRNPPIQEALCELQFAGATSDWDPTIPGRLYERIKDVYSGKPRQQLQAGIQLGGDPSTAALRWEAGVPRVQFLTPAENRILAVGQNVISLSTLPPYDGWEDFRPRIAAALAAYQDIVQPEGVKRIGVRYINRFVMKGDHLHLGELFTTPPQLPDELDASLSNFFIRLEAMYSDIPVKLIQTFGSIPSEPGTVAFVLDLDVIREWEEKGGLPVEEAMNQVDLLREREREAFEASITDQAREMFDAD